MHPPPLRPIFASGHHLWPCIAVAGVLALSTPATAAKECHRETPRFSLLTPSLPSPSP
jgi:hypothetical protein